MSTDTTPTAAPGGRPDDAPAGAPGDLPGEAVDLPGEAVDPAATDPAATTGDRLEEPSGTTDPTAADEDPTAAEEDTAEEDAAAAGTAPTVVRAPAARPLTAALLNLSGLGLGYLHLRAWARLVVALAATAGLAWLALPIGREPIDVWWAVGYVGALALFALDAAYLARRRARRDTPPRTVWAPRAARRVAWATLAVVPLLGAAYVVTQHEVLEQHLAYDLDQAEEDVRSASGTAFAPYERLYDGAYTTYVRTATEHPGTRAAERVPGLVDALYEQAKGDDVCNTVTAARHFAEPGTPDPLRTAAAQDLPGALHDCGLRATRRGDLGTARLMLDDLLANHPTSEPAQGLPDDLAAWRDDVIQGLGRFGGCTDTRQAGDLVSYLAGFDTARVSALADEAREQVPARLLTCGVRMFEGEQYTAALDSLENLLENHPRADQAEYAERLRIAAGMARVEPDADVPLPARDEPAGTVTLTFYNHSPQPFDVVYTGPATGVVSVEACDDCALVTEGHEPECTGYSLTLPSTTVTVPAGRYLTATERDGNVVGWHKEGVKEEHFTTSQTFCTWTYEH